MIKHLLFFTFFLYAAITNAQQKTALVLSGGGADALAHIGVLKAIDELNIQVDCIVGTSMGAFIGGLYASGYSARQIEALVLSEEFNNMVNTSTSGKESYLLLQNQPNPAIVNWNVSLSKLGKPVLPTHIVDPQQMDLALLKLFSGPTIAAKNNFDSLFIPFRCIASDIQNKESVVHKSGNLSYAIRTSMTYPFFIQPIEYNGQLLYDGGLYNNFGIDVAQNEFLADFIIGSTVSSGKPNINEADLLSQVKSMVINRKTSVLDSTLGIIIAPNLDNPIYEFSNIPEKIQMGYLEAKSKLLVAISNNKVSIRSSGWTQKQQNYNSSCLFPKIDTLEVIGEISLFAKKHLQHYFKSNSNFQTTKKSFLKATNNQAFAKMYPTVEVSNNKNVLVLRTKKNKLLQTQVGGFFTSKSFNTGYLGINYQSAGNFTYGITANTYFGKFYNSGAINGFIHSSKVPLKLSFNYTLNRFNYTQNSLFTTTSSTNAFLTQTENISSIRLALGTSINSKLEAFANSFSAQDAYFPNQTVLAGDTLNQTLFKGNSVGLNFQYSTLTNKQFPIKGKNLAIQYNAVIGEETYINNSNPKFFTLPTYTRVWHEFKLDYLNVYQNLGKLNLGFSVNANYSTQPLFATYTATLARANQFNPIPESNLFFLESYRSNQYIGLGHQFIVELLKRVEYRIEGYIFQPFKTYRVNETNNKLVVQSGLQPNFTVLSSSILFKSPVGPLSVYVNYYFNGNSVVSSNLPVSISVNFGYLFFNKRYNQ